MLKGLNSFQLGSGGKNSRITDATDFDQHIYLHVPSGERIELNYNDFQIFITVREDLSRPLIVQECETKYHTTISLEYSGGETKEDNIAVLKEYLLHCGKEYYKTVLSKVMRDKLQVYVWDENYWDQSHKWTKTEH